VVIVTVGRRKEKGVPGAPRKAAVGGGVR
jgi:hypothetical protein